MRSRALVLRLSVLAALAAMVPVAQAHHSFAAEFDADQPVELHGVITKMEWLNPHTWMHLDVANADGTTTAWMIEGATPNTLLRRGFTREAVKAGTEITIIGYRAKNGANRANGARARAAEELVELGEGGVVERAILLVDVDANLFGEVVGLDPDVAGGHRPRCAGALA